MTRSGKLAAGGGAIAALLVAILMCTAGRTTAALPIMQSGSVVIALTPAALTVAPGQTFTLTVQVQAGAAQVDAARASLDFDPAYLQVEAITAGDVLPFALTNAFSNILGTVDFAAGKLSDFPSGTFTLAQVRFVAGPETPSTGIAFHFGLPRNSDATLGGNSVLGGTTPATIEIASPTATPTPTPAPLYDRRVNVGGVRYVDKAGYTWVADRVFSAGAWGYVGGVVKTYAVAIAGTLDDPLYQNDRTWTSSAAPGYRFTVPAGQYEITFKFAENYWSAAGKRKFTIKAEGKNCFANYDIFAAAGAKNKAAPDKTCIANVSDGELTLNFIKVLDAPKVDAIRVLWLGPVPTPTSTHTPSPTFTPTETPTPTETATPGTVTVTPTASLYVKRVHSGSTTAYTDGAGNVWAADKIFSTGTWGYSGGSVASTTSAIANTTDDPLYQKYRLWSSTANPAYRFTVPNGTYSVKLLFMEPTYTAANKRKFDIRIEGTTRTTAYDIYAASGARYKAISKTYTVNVTDGLLEIAFIRLSGFDNPLVCGVQVRQQ